MKFRVKNSLALGAMALCVFLTGCGAPAPLVYSQLEREPARGEHFTVVDNRVSTEKKSEFLSLSVSSSNYGIYRIGDEEIRPDRINYIKTRLQQKSESRLIGKTVQVQQAVILNNQQALMRRLAVGSAAGGVVGVVISDAMNKSLPFIDTTVKLQIDGKEYTSRQAAVYINTGQSPSTNANMAISIKQTLDLAIDEIAAGII